MTTGDIRWDKNELNVIYNGKSNFSVTKGLYVIQAYRLTEDWSFGLAIIETNIKSKENIVSFTSKTNSNFWTSCTACIKNISFSICAIQMAGYGQITSFWDNPRTDIKFQIIKVN